MRVGLLADTHVPDRQAELPRALFRAFDGVEHILHAGDITQPFVLEELGALAPVTAVRGDWDAAGLHLPQRLTVELGGRRIGLIHGRRPRMAELPPFLLSLLTRRLWTPGLDRWLLNNFREDRVDVIVYGHLHRPRRALVDGVWLINPGGAWTGPFERWIKPVVSPTVAILETESLAVRFIPLSEGE